MPNKIDEAIKALSVAIEEHPDHLHSGAIADTITCLVDICNHIGPEYRYVCRKHVEFLQDLAYEETVKLRR